MLTVGLNVTSSDFFDENYNPTLLAQMFNMQDSDMWIEELESSVENNELFVYKDKLDRVYLVLHYYSMELFPGDKRVFTNSLHKELEKRFLVKDEVMKILRSTGRVIRPLVVVSCDH